ncbi:diguanylate cyclase [Sulfurimonas sp.]|uniref:GGDEF domain-containing response regulator n=1 Tax=Sulfurimonas sp. TaxID=2022749 RepID=UPI002AB31B1E|nr:diguanylate cyclase [Sulfurimonas sp.]
MKRILIVQDNQTLAKLIARKISISLKYEVDIAYKLSEAKLFLKKYKYFLTILDINLPDTQEAQVVDYVLKTGHKVIVLSANIDKEFRKKILKKNIIDYINKSGVNDINYVIQTIQRLEKNQEHTILVVEDSMIFRKILKETLENLFFKVIAVNHGEEALGMLNENPDISLVLTDYNMPVMNGLELTKEIRKKYKKSELCVMVLSSSDDEETNAIFLKQGANDYIKKPYSKEEFFCRIHNSIEALENIQFITNYANRDVLTGLYNHRYFYKHMKEYSQDAKVSGEQFAVGIVNIDNFKEIEKKFGQDISDEAIINLSEILRTKTNYRDFVARFEGEEFCIILKNINRYSATDIFERLRQEVEKSGFTTKNNDYIKCTVSIGVSLHTEDNLEETISQADMMLLQAQQNGKNQVVFD